MLALVARGEGSVRVAHLCTLMGLSHAEHLWQTPRGTHGPTDTPAILWGQWDGDQMLRQATKPCCKQERAV